MKKLNFDLEASLRKEQLERAQEELGRMLLDIIDNDPPRAQLLRERLPDLMRELDEIIATHRKGGGYEQ